MSLQSILMLAGAAGALGAATGLALLLMPRQLLETDSPLRRVLLETHIGHVFNRRFSIERRVYRRHRLFGVLVLGGAVALASLIWILFQHPIAAAAMQGALGKAAWRAVVATVAATDVVLFAVGACLWVRPSVLKGIEAAANRWIEPVAREGASAAVSGFVRRSPRLTGALLVISGLICLRPF